MCYRCGICERKTPEGQPALLIREMKADQPREILREIKVCTTCKEGHDKGLTISQLQAMPRPPEPPKQSPTKPNPSLYRDNLDDVVGILLGKPYATDQDMEISGKQTGTGVRVKKTPPLREQLRNGRGRQSSRESVHGMQARQPNSQVRDGRSGRDNRKGQERRKRQNSRRGSSP